MADEQMQRVKKDRPCPVCCKPDWCLIAEDGSAAICARIEDGSLKKCGSAGFLHVLRDRHDGHDGHKPRVRPRHLVKRVSGAGGQAKDFGAMALRYQGQLTAERLGGLAHARGVSANSLWRL